MDKEERFRRQMEMEDKQARFQAQLEEDLGRENEAALSAPTVNKTAEGTRAVARGATFQLSPHIEAGLSALFGDKSYKENLADLRANAKMFEKQVGVPSRVGLELGGTLGTLALLTRNPGLAATMGLSVGLPLGAQVARGAATSGVIGGVEELAQNENPTVQGVAKHALTSAGAGAAVPVAIAGVQAANEFRKAMTTKGAIANAQREGVSELTERLRLDLENMGYKTLDQQEAFLKSRLGNMQDPTNVSLLDLMYDLSPSSTTANFIRGALQEESPLRMAGGMHVTSRARRGVSDLERETQANLGNRTLGTEELAKLEAKRSANASNAFGAAYADQTPIAAPEVQRFLNEPYVQEVLIPRAKSYFDIEKQRAGGQGWDFPEVSKMVPTGRMVFNNATMSMEPEMVRQTTLVPTTQLLHTLKKVDTDTRKFLDQSQLNKRQLDLLRSAEKSNIEGITQDAMTAARQTNSEFDKAMSQYRSDLTVEKAAELGRNIFSYRDPKELKKLVDAMSPEEFAAYRIEAAREQMMRIEKMRDINPSSGDVNKMVGSEDSRTRLRTLFDNDSQFERYMRTIKQQKLFTDVKAFIGPGSSTMGNAEQKGISAQIAKGTPSALGALFFGNPQPLAQQLSGRALAGKARTPLTEAAGARVNTGVMAAGPRGLDEIFKTMRSVQNYDPQRRMSRMQAAFPFMGVAPGLLDEAR